MSIMIYGIECRENGITYVGHTTDHKTRWRVHRSRLNRGIHSVADMLADWRKYGKSAFVMRVLEHLASGVEPHVVEATKLRWRAHFARLGRLYNVPKCSMCGRPYDVD